MYNLDKNYSNIIKNNPLLTKKEEIILAKKIQKGDSNARKKLIQSNYRLVISIAKKYHRSDINFDDLLQESSIGLLKAVDKFNPDLGYKFSTYACWWIKQAALSYINEQTGSFKVPTHSRMLYSKIRHKVDQLELETGKKPSIKQVAEALEESPKKIAYTVKANKQSISYDADKSEDVLSLKDKLPDESFYSNPADVLEKKELMQIIKRNLQKLSPKEDKIIRLRFGLDEDPTNTTDFPLTQEMKDYL